MPKRKHSEDEDSDKLWKKLKRMEKKLKKRKKRLRRKNSSSSDSSTPSNKPIPSINEDVDDLLPMYEMHDDTNDLDTAAAMHLPGPASESSVPGPAADPAPLELAPTPNTTCVVTTETISSVDKPPDDEIALDDDILIFLGETPTKDKKFGPKLQNDIANRWEHVATSGVNKDTRKEFQVKYLTPENSKLIDPPALNLEVKAALSESLQKKDTAIQNKQKQISAAISCIGQALRRALSQEQKDAEMLKLLIDAGRIVCDVQHTESMMRRGFISSCIKKEVKDHLNDTQIDTFLFGEKLADTLKAAKSIHKSGSEIRAGTTVPRPIPKNKTLTRPLNSRPPATASRPPFAGRRLEETAPAYAPAAYVPPPRRRAPPPPPPPAPPPPAPRSQQRPRAPRR